MNILHLRLTVSLENWDFQDFERPHGPLFTHWLPNGVSDAIEIKCPHEGNNLRLWFARRGYINNGFIRYDTKRSEIDETVMKRQGKLEAGALHGQGVCVTFSTQEINAIKGNLIGHEDYIAAGKRVVDFLHKPISNLVALLKYQYGQYWLPEIEAWDSRRNTLGSYCSSTLHLQWCLKEDEEWENFLPTDKGETIAATLGDFSEYLSKEDWDKIRTTADLNNDTSLASKILGRANELLDNEQLRQAFVEATTAAELAVYRHIKLKSNIIGIDETHLKQFFELPLIKQLAITTIISEVTSGELIKKALKAIEIRNKIVHEGFHPDATDTEALKSLFCIVAALLNIRHKFPGLNSGSNKLDAPIKV